MNVCNDINAHQWNEHVENWNRVKYHKINKRLNNVNITKSY